ncbi:hypothetical protein [Natronosalvus halobius]|uniref:hypothetical protein n=1 Tax=Natronosalvus halobius TaxID=2953746 RepID=UPI00209D27CD|nr:hypothetical protein [Natronosalvus halobius]USZ71702.1 hypothetical protein NGM15_16835 [Natronosalvus halobius]
MAQKSPTTDVESSTTLRNSLVSRRSYVRSVATAAVAAGVFGGVADAAAAESDYETVTLDPGEDHQVNVGDGETLENVLFDCTAEGARVTIAAHATDWTIRNVGIEGEFDVGSPDAAFGISDQGGNTSTIENVYVADGAIHGSEATDETAFWVSPEHNGHIDFKNVNVQNFPDNGIYASAPAGKGGGTIHIDECYAANNYVANFRIGSAGSAVTNSSVHVERDGYGGRGIWVWAPGECEIDNCQLELNGHNYAIDAGANGSGTSVTVTDTDYSTDFHGGVNETAGSSVDLGGDVGNDPEPTIPDGVPKTAEDAASGN